MSQRPVQFPGATLSRNSQIRNSALQGEAYTVMDQDMARLPVTADESLVSIAANPLVANRPHFARIKIRDNASFTAGTVAVGFGSTGPAFQSTCGAAIYEYQPTRDGLFDLALVAGGFQTRDVSPAGYTADMWLFPLASPFLMDRRKTYVLGVVTDNGAHLPANAYCITLPTAASVALTPSKPNLLSGFALGGDAVYPLTATGGWAQRIPYSGDASSHLLFGVSTMLYGAILPVGASMAGSIY